MSIKIVEPSLNSTPQDLGRKNYASLGIARSGAMDEYSLILANILLGNRIDEAGIELCLKGGKYEFLETHYFVLSGADFGARLEGKNIQTCKVYKAQKREILELGIAKVGFRGYLCIAGGFGIKSFLGSKSSDSKMAVGLFDGRNLMAGDILPHNNSFVPFNINARQCENPILNMPQTLTIRVILGSNDDAFSLKGIETFLSTTYKVGLKSDRMAICAESNATIEHKNSADIISDPIVFGSIQVPKSGKPIVLMAGRQSTGGYTKIATVIQNDLMLLAQARLGVELRFQSIDFDCALNLYKQRAQFFKDLDRALNLDFENLLC